MECACSARLLAVEEQLRELLAMQGGTRGLQFDQALAQTGESISDGDTAWMLTATTLVLFMTIPGQAVFYAGMVRTENVLATSMEVFSIACLMTVLWHLIGYSIAFGPITSDTHSSGLYGDLSRIFLQGLTSTSTHQLAPTIPESLFCAYQLTFAMATPTLMCGSFAERMKYFPCLIFMGCWLLLVYCPVAHAIWHPDGFLNKLGVMDFAGGLVVHLNAGIASLMCVIVIGNRRMMDNNLRQRSEPHNILFTVIGCCMMWVAWYGFNAGGAYKANSYSSNILLVTQIGASVAAFSWMFVEWHHRGSPSVLGMVNGGVAGLVCITPACGYVDPAGAFFIGLFGGAACLYGTQIKHYIGFDDAIDAFGVNTTGGIVGTILVGFFATSQSGPNDGLVNAIMRGQAMDGLNRLIVQFYGILFVTLWSGIISLILLVVIDNVVGLRVTAYEERLGLDEALHAESLLHDKRRQSIVELLNYQSMYGSMHDKTVHGDTSHSAPSSHGEATRSSLLRFFPSIADASEHGNIDTSNRNRPLWLGGEVYGDYSQIEVTSSSKDSAYYQTANSPPQAMLDPKVFGRKQQYHSGSEDYDQLGPGEVRFRMDDISRHDMPIVYDD